MRLSTKILTVLVELTDKSEIDTFFRRNVELHIYEIGDLDPFFWPHTRWYGWRSHDTLRAACLVYGGFDPPTLIAFDDGDAESSTGLMAAIEPVLADNLHVHLSANLAPCFANWRWATRTQMLKMSLPADADLPDLPATSVERLGPRSAGETRAFLQKAHPGNWFDARTLETGCYFAIRADGELASVAGVHVFSADHKVAALGNIATRPDLRGRGLGRRTTTALCRHLRGRVDVIGLNVQADNEAALQCYGAIGFEVCARYLEGSLSR